ncbi:MAG TPA: molybdopterin-dependent oxidoreductase [Syntrophales bacterium]|nr:molybdopterin-dependent oxidoreductase [Syntrophales bacterium]
MSKEKRKDCELPHRAFRRGTLQAEVTACTLDCPDACSLLVDKDRQGRIRIRGNPDHPFTAGFACRKIGRFLERLQSPHRITVPLLRAGGKWKPVSWNDALDLCAEKIQEYRKEPASILHIQGDAAKGVLKQAGRLFFARLGAGTTEGSLCDAAGYSAYDRDCGSRCGNDMADILQARRIVNWGKDLCRSSVHAAALVRRARRQGTRLLTISPGGDGNVSFSDRCVRIRPGTDRFLAAAVLQIFTERGRIRADILRRTANGPEFLNLIMKRNRGELCAACDVSPEDVETVASWYLEEGPTATLVGAGLQRYDRGGENVRFINAVAMLSGNLGRSGGGSYYHKPTLRNLNLGWAQAPPGPQLRTLLLPAIGREILAAQDPPIRMLWVNASNVVNQAPGFPETVRAFEKVDFKVVVDGFMTDTADRADLFLPATFMFEQEDVTGSYLHDFVLHARKVLETPGKAASDYRILSELGRRLDPPVLLPDPDACFRASLASPYLDVSLEELREKGFARAKRPAVAYAGMRFDHPDGRYRFPAELHDEPPPPPGYPLRLLTLIRGDAMHSQIPPEDQESPPSAWIAPDNPALEHLRPDRDVYLVSPVGRLRVKVQRLPGLHRTTVLCRRGDWAKLGGGVNQIIAAGLTDMGGGAAFYRQYVKLENGPAGRTVRGRPHRGGKG